MSVSELMGKKIIIIPISAILLVWALPSLMSSFIDMTDAAQDGDVDKLSEEIVDITVDEVKNKLTAPILALVFGAIAFIGSLIGYKIIFK